MAKIEGWRLAPPIPNSKFAILNSGVERDRRGREGGREGREGQSPIEVERDSHLLIS